jgi:hypothetical protein
MLARNSLQPGVELTWKYASSVVFSQTGRLVHTQAIKSDSMQLQSTIKLFVSAGISIKPLAQNTDEELNSARECPRFYLPYLERCITYYAFQCFRLSDSELHSAFRIILQIHKSVGRSNMLHQVLFTDCEFYSTTASMKCKFTSTQLLYDFIPPLIQFLMDFWCSSAKPTIQLIRAILQLR